MKNAKYVVLAAALLVLALSAYKAAFGVTYLAKYLYYDNHSWGTIEYRSDTMTATGEYREQKNPSYINMQMTLDEPYNGDSRYSITFKFTARDDNWGDHKGERALAVYDDFYNSKGDIFTRTDITASIICAGCMLVSAAVLLAWLLSPLDKNDKYKPSTRL